MNDSIASQILIAFSIICLIAWWNDWPPVAANEITTYQVRCNECKPEERILYREVYRIDPSSHTVTHWVKESGFLSIYRDCAIRDKNNWRCDTRDPESKWDPKLMDGIFSENTIFPMPEQVSWYKWWWLHFLESIRSK